MPMPFVQSIKKMPAGMDGMDDTHAFLKLEQARHHITVEKEDKELELRENLADTLHLLRIREQRMVSGPPPCEWCCAGGLYSAANPCRPKDGKLKLFKL